MRRAIKCRGDDITGENGGEDEVSQQVERPSGEGVQQVTREWTDAEGRDRVA